MVPVVCCVFRALCVFFLLGPAVLFERVYSLPAGLVFSFRSCSCFWCCRFLYGPAICSREFTPWFAGFRSLSRLVCVVVFGVVSASFGPAILFERVYSLVSRCSRSPLCVCWFCVLPFSSYIIEVITEINIDIRKEQLRGC